MSVRLQKILKDLNVGLNTTKDFLQKKGIDVKGPNDKIDFATHEMLIKEYGTAKDLDTLRQKQASKKKTEVEVTSNKSEKVEKNNSKESEKNVDKPQINVNVIRKIDLDNLNKPIKNNKDKDNTKKEEKAQHPDKDVIDVRDNLDIKKEEVVSTQKTSKKEEKAIEDAVNSSEVFTEKTNKNLNSEGEKNAEIKQEEIKTSSNNKNSNEDIEKTKEHLKNKTKSGNNSTTTSKEAPIVIKKTVTKSDKQEEKTISKTDTKEEEEIFRYREHSVENNIVIKGTIDLKSINDKTRPAKKTKELVKKSDTSSDDATKKKRSRIKKGKVDLEKGNDVNNDTPKNSNQSGTNANKNNQGATKPAPKLTKRPQGQNNNNNNSHKKSFTKAPLTEEEVQKQIKETLARLTDNKRAKNKGAKYRKEKREAQSQRHQEELDNQERESSVLKITEFVTANDLANMMNIPVVKVIQTCMSIGMMVSINQRLDAETINIVADEFGFTTEYVSAEVVEAIAVEEDKEEDLLPRAPIVTVMGHVDHGKTSLLDNIRQTNVIAGEAGGITQHIGAYNVKLKSGKKITFLDTPGHEAFTAMRARGAQITDIAIIIVAADDSVMPQTVEAINHASAAGVPIVFAINKIDKPGANPEKIKEALAAMNYLVEDWGGKYQSQEISAKNGIGIDELLEKVLLEAEILDLKANPNRRAIGSIVESSLDKGRGYTSTVLIQNGTLNVGDVIVAGTSFGRVRAMFNERNQKISSVRPAEPVQILGLNGAPQAGDSLHVLETEQEAREIANKREQLQREQGLRTQKILTLDDIGRRIAIGNFQQLNLIVKADMDGSVEALSDSLLKLSTPEIQLNVIHKGVGQISESDISLSAASDAIIVGFQVRPSQQARRMAEAEGVDVRLYSIIYDAIEEIKSAMEGMLSPEIKEVVAGYVEVREVFKITKVGTVAGCIVKEGKLKRSHKIRLVRDGIVVYSGNLGSLKRFKDDVKEVVMGLECGLNITNFNDIKVGDIIEPFEEFEIKKTL